MIPLELPRAGLDELLRAWSGDGPLVDALASCVPDDVAWTAADIRRRARRVLLGMLATDLLALPSSVSAWRQVMPITTHAHRVLAGTPIAGVRWGETARRFGWPPRQYVARPRHRVHDETALTTLAWLAERLGEALAGLGTDAPALSSAITTPIDVLHAAVAEVLTDTQPARPDRSDLTSLAASGHPWTVVARIARQVARAELDPTFVAYELLLPEHDLEWRLHHLATFGEVVRALRSERFHLTWVAPFGGRSGGPRIAAISPRGERWELWYEGAGLRNHHGLGTSAYASATARIANVGGPIGADVVLRRVTRPTRVLLLESKWSDDRTYVVRDGFHQAASYALDARDGFARSVWSFVVGPRELIPAPSTSVDLRRRWSITLGTAPTQAVPGVVRAFLADDPQAL